MHQSDGRLIVFAAGACLAAATLVGCNRSDRTDTTGTAGTSGTADQAVTLTGCLQRGGGVMDKFVLTSMNGTEGSATGSAAVNPNGTANPAPGTTPGSVGTGGTTAGGDVVGREQHAAATKTYRLDGDDDQLRDLVGKQVRVSGKLTDRGDLGRPDQPDTTSGGKVDRDISASELARVKVDSISKVSDACGNSAPMKN